MNAVQHNTSRGRGHSARGRLAEIWADITNAHHRYAEIDRPWLRGSGRASHSG